MKQLFLTIVMAIGMFACSSSSQKEKNTEQSNSDSVTTVNSNEKVEETKIQEKVVEETDNKLSLSLDAFFVDHIVSANYSDIIFKRLDGDEMYFSEEAEGVDYPETGAFCKVIYEIKYGIPPGINDGKEKQYFKLLKVEKSSAPDAEIIKNINKAAELNKKFIESISDDEYAATTIESENTKQKLNGIDDHKTTKSASGYAILNDLISLQEEQTSKKWTIFAESVIAEDASNPTMLNVYSENHISYTGDFSQSDFAINNFSLLDGKIKSSTTKEEVKSILGKPIIEKEDVFYYLSYAFDGESSFQPHKAFIFKAGKLVGVVEKSVSGY